MYNSENTITNVLKSINYFVKEYNGKVEIICIDDGSKDNTVDVVEEYIKNKKEFMLVKKSNGGVSSARNLGIKKAIGKYVTFIDADDVIDFQAIINILEKLSSNTDLLFSNVIPLEKDLVIDNITQIQRIELYKDLADIGKYRVPIGVCFTIYSRKLLIDNSLFFDTNLRVGEDLYFNLQCIAIADNIILTSKSYYSCQEAHSVYLFKKENLDNELYFRKVTDKFFSIQNDDRVRIVNQRMAVKGIIFLVYRYFVPGIQKKYFQKKEAIKKLKKISKSSEYIDYISSAKLDKYLSGREKLVRKLLEKQHYHLTIFLGLIINKLKPEKR